MTVVATGTVGSDDDGVSVGEARLTRAFPSLRASGELYFFVLVSPGAIAYDASITSAKYESVVRDVAF